MRGLDEATILVIARRVAELLREERALGESLIDAAEVGRRLGLARSTVYDRAAELGAIQLGAGPRPRLRFDPRMVEAAITRRRSSIAEEPNRPLRPRARRERSATRAGSAPLLPIRRPESW